MSERREKVIQEIKEVAERINIKLNDYRTRYYKEMPVASRKKIYNSLENAICEVEKLCFANEMLEYIFYTEIAKLQCKFTTETIKSHLENVVNETLKYYNEEFSTVICDFINRLQKKLEKKGYDFTNEAEYLKDKLSVTKAFKLLVDKYTDLKELKESISLITDIDILRTGTKKAGIHELYGIKTFLLELEERISVIDTFEDKTYINVIFEYIYYRMNFAWFEDNLV